MTRASPPDGGGRFPLYFILRRKDQHDQERILQVKDIQDALALLRDMERRRVSSTSPPASLRPLPAGATIASEHGET